MVGFKTTFSAAFCILASAVLDPAAESNSLPFCFKEYTAQYDDLPFTEGPPNPIPTPYLGLNYSIFQEDRNELIPPASGIGYAAAFGGTGSIAIPKDKQNKQLFRLQSFDFACDAGIPQPECAISIKGYRFGRQVANETIYFPRLDPGHVLSDFKMNHTRFDWRWAELSKVEFNIARADNGGDIYGALLIDDFKYYINGLGSC